MQMPRAPCSSIPTRTPHHVPACTKYLVQNEHMKKAKKLTKIPQQIISLLTITGWAGLRDARICRACPSKWATPKFVPRMFIATVDLAHGHDESYHTYIYSNSCIWYQQLLQLSRSLWYKTAKLETPNTHGGYATTVQDSCAIARPWKAGSFNIFFRVFPVFIA